MSSASAFGSSVVFRVASVGYTVHLTAPRCLESGAAHREAAEMVREVLSAGTDVAWWE